MYREARLKLKWTEKHIAKLEILISALPDHYVATVEINPKTGNQVLKYDIRNRSELFADIALTVGDALNNLKSALDYAWLGTLTRLAPSAISGKTKFPVFETRDKFEAGIGGIEKQIAVPKLFRLLRKIAPYEGGNGALWAIHRLNIIDKHNLLIPIIEFFSIEGIEVQNDTGEVERGFSPGIVQKPPYFIEFRHGLRVKNKGHAAMSIGFDKETTMYGMDIAGMFQPFMVTVLNVVNLLENV